MFCEWTLQVATTIALLTEMQNAYMIVVYADSHPARKWMCKMALQTGLYDEIKRPGKKDGGLATFKRPVCRRCGGLCRVPCHICGGTGEVKFVSFGFNGKAPCRQCLGTSKESCPVCHGIGVTVSA
jgi:hypothetical protein